MAHNLHIENDNLEDVFDSVGPATSRPTLKSTMNPCIWSTRVDIWPHKSSVCWFFYWITCTVYLLNKNSKFVIPGQQQAPCKFKKEAGLCSGRDIRQINGITIKSCELMCSSEPTCASFFFYESIKRCYMKYHACTSAQLTSKTNAVYNQNIKDRE
jgi:hypothetical protein